MKYVDRLKRMDDLIRRKATGKAEEFARKMEISRSQLLQDIKNLREMGAPIEFDTYRQTYSYDKDYVLTPGFLVDGRYVRGGNFRHTYYQIEGKNSISSFLNLSIILIFLLFNTLCTGQIKGSIIDYKTKKSIAGVDVFVNGSTHYTTSDDAGQFILNELRPGFLDLVLYKKGYQLFKSSLRLQEGKAAILNLVLHPEKIKKDAIGNKGKELQLFKNGLLGDDKGTQLMNEEVVSFNQGKDHIEVTSSDPLVINDNSLGYQIRYYILKGMLKEDKIALIGYHNFQKMPASSSGQILLWEKERLKVHQGSLRHLLQSMVSGKTEQEGFRISDKQGSDLNANSLVISSRVAGYYKIFFPDSVKINFGSGATNVLGRSEVVEVNSDGVLLASSHFKIEGPMANNRLFDRLPLDYDPAVKEGETFFRYYEKIYVHTDKPYYYSGEPMWFKGYVNYGEPLWRDSLSKVVYVELINPQKRISQSKMLPIDSGFFHNDFILPDTLTPGTYYLRAYTSLSRNFGDRNLYVKPISVLGITDKADPGQGKTTTDQSNLLSITTDKASYKTRDKIVLTLKTSDKDGNPQSANLSVSVTDTEQVVPIEEPKNIIQDFPINEQDRQLVMEFRYPIDNGLSFSGRFLNDKGKPEKTALNIMQWNPRNMMLAETDERGIFTQTGLSFYDSMKFSVKSDKAKDKPYGNVELLSQEVPALDFEQKIYKMSTFKTESPQRIISDYEVSKEVTVLEDVTIKGKKIATENNRQARPYGRGDKIINGKDMNLSYSNILYSLLGIPGVQVDPIGGTVIFTRASGLTVQGNSSPLVTLNDVPSNISILLSIDPSIVESIEVTKRINVLYGSQGANGVIAIYTKDGTQAEGLKSSQNFQVLKIKGYSSSRVFPYIDYSDAKIDDTKTDYRSTLYWNHKIITNPRKGNNVITFFASDLHGQYRIAVDGVSQKGEPIRCEHLIEIE
jgi:Carboxypeptidase regulatory-like domain/TonB-dependent Receptor Plug Domain/HTH domain